MPIFLALNDDLVLDGSTLRRGGHVITIHETPVSVAADGGLVLKGTFESPMKP